MSGKGKGGSAWSSIGVNSQLCAVNRSYRTAMQPASIINKYYILFLKS